MKKLMTALLAIFMSFTCVLAINAAMGGVVYVKGKCNIEYGLDTEGCYTSFDEAYNNVNNGGILRLYSNAKAESTTVLDKNFSLDLYNHSLYADNGFEVTNSSFEFYGSGYIYTNDTEDRLSQFLRVHEDIKLKFDNGRYDVSDCSNACGGAGGDMEGWPSETAWAVITEDSSYYNRYSSIQEAINANLNKTLQIMVMKDISEDITVPDNGYVLIDNGGYVVKGSFTNNGKAVLGANYSASINGVFDLNITNNGQLQVSDGSIYTSDVSAYLYNSNYYTCTKNGDLYYVNFNYDYWKLDVETSDELVADNVEEFQDPFYDNDGVVLEFYGSPIDTSEIDADVLKAIEDKTTSVGNNASAIQYFDIYVMARNSNDEITFVNSLKDEIEVIINLSDETFEAIKDKDVKIVRYHKGEAAVLNATLDKDAKTLTFKSRLFSAYAIVASDKTTSDNGGNSNNTNNNTNSNTSSTTTRTEANTPCEEWYNSKNWTWSESANQCVYKVKNTSAK